MTGRVRDARHSSFPLSFSYRDCRLQFLMVRFALVRIFFFLDHGSKPRSPAPSFQSFKLDFCPLKQGCCRLTRHLLGISPLKLFGAFSTPFPGATPPGECLLVPFSMFPAFARGMVDPQFSPLNARCPLPISPHAFCALTVPLFATLPRISQGQHTSFLEHYWKIHCVA